MKKSSILLLILLSAQLYGCSAQVSELNETVSSTPEMYSLEPMASPTEENDTKEVEAPAEENGTKEVEAPAEENDTKEAETPAEEFHDDSYYRAVTDIPCSDVESYAARVKQLFLEHDWPAISSEIAYPITISDITYYNSTDFLNVSNSFDGNLEEDFFSALEEEDCIEMFCSWEGIMLGETGQIWISEVLDAEFASQGLKIIAINGMLKK